MSGSSASHGEVPVYRRDPDAIEFTSPEAAQYAAAVEALGATIDSPPTEQFAYGTDRGQRLEVYAPFGAKALPMLAFFPVAPGSMVIWAGCASWPPS